jgi:hypothetical protein
VRKGAAAFGRMLNIELAPMPYQRLMRMALQEALKRAG